VQILRKITVPFSLLFGLITSVRNRFYDKGIFKSQAFEIPIICVGNLSAGGTGKTPMVEYLVRLLQDNYKIAILSRGYKRETSGFILADGTATVKTIGDEPMQYFSKFKNVSVAVDTDRVNGVKRLLNSSSKPDVILLDDAYQHRKIRAGKTILLSTYDNLYIDDRMLPSGTLRERTQGASRADSIVITKCPDSLNNQEQKEIGIRLQIASNQSLFYSKIKYGDKIIGKVKSYNLEELKNYELALVTGIANTKPLETFLNDRHIKYRHFKFADHHDFSKNEIAKIFKQFTSDKKDKTIFLTTEKDYVRSFSSEENFYYLPIETEIINGQKDFNKMIINYVEQGSGNS
jgi:tetraacyldisaccharide 4'-kinase